MHTKVAVTRKAWARGVLVSGCAGLVVASSMSFWDWTVNPAGIFHGQNGTNWYVVWETWVSWFIPVLFGTGALTLSVLFWRSRPRVS